MKGERVKIGGVGKKNEEFKLQKVRVYGKVELGKGVCDWRKREVIIISTGVIKNKLGKVFSNKTIFGEKH